MKKGFIISILITVLQFIVAGILFSNLPEQIPIHWNISGAADRFGSKAFIFLMPFLSLAFTLLLNWLPTVMPKGENIQKSGRLYPLLMVMVSLLMAVLLILIATASFGHSTPTLQVIFGLLGIMMLFIGNYLPKVKPNYMLGIRLPWTLANETVWTKTHRFGGWVFFVSGLLFIGGIFLPVPANFILPCVGLFAGLLIITGYAFHLHKNV